MTGTLRTNQQVGLDFQHFIKECLLRHFGPRAVIERARPNNANPADPGNERGRDFEFSISQDGPIELFGVPIRSGARYSVEVKFSVNTIDYAHVAPNLTRMQDGQFELVFVVTNSHFPPSTQVSLYENFTTLSDKIVLIEGRHLKGWTECHGYNWPQAIEIRYPTGERIIDGIAIEANSLATRTFGGLGRTFFMAFRNVTIEDRTVEVSALSDLAWHFTDRQLSDETEADLTKPVISGEDGIRKTFIIPQGQTRAWRLSGIFLHSPASAGLHRRRELGQKEDGARIVAGIGDDLVPLFDGIRPIRLCFNPSFTGKHNTALRDEIKPMFENIERGNLPAALTVIHIEGSAGVGKSRLVEEFLPPRQYSHIALVHHTIEAVEPSAKETKERWKHIQAVLKGFATPKTAWPKKILSVIGLLDILLGESQNQINIGNWGAIVIVIEDLHNAPKAVLGTIREILSSHHDLKTNVFLILTGRNDDSYANPEYRKFLSDLSGIPRKTVGGSFVRYHLSPLEPEEARDMIGKLVEGIQPEGIDRIYQLSGSVPHHIVQCIEFLLDASLVAITSRDTLSIVDLRTFDLRSARLPESMDDLFECRFHNLGRLTGAWGKAVQEAVLAATLFGTRIPLSVCALIDTALVESVKQELIDRRYFALGDDGDLQWHHENIYLFFNRHRRAKAQRLSSRETAHPIGERFIESARLVYHNAELWPRLEQLQQGDVATLTGDIDTALDCFQEMIAAAARIRTFTTLDAESRYFYHLEYAVEVLRLRHGDSAPDTIWKLIALKAFIGGYHKGLRYEVEAYEYGINVLPYLNLPESIAGRCQKWLRAIDGQVHLDSGFVGAALHRLLHLIHVIRVEELECQGASSDQDMLFDIHNALRLLFTYTNFRSLAEDNGRLARAYRINSEIPELEDVDLGDLALFHMLTDRRKCIDLLEQALKVNATHDTERHKPHSLVSLIASRLPDQLRNREALENAVVQTSKVISECELRGYHSILPRIYLLKAVATYLLGCAEEDTSTNHYFDAAMAIANQGLGACEAYSIGFISWQLRNLKAILYGRRQKWQQAVREIDTAVASLSKEGLFLMGSDCLVGAAPIVLANFVKIGAARLPDRRILAVLRQLHGFEPYNCFGEDGLPRIKEQARNRHHIVPGYEKKPDWLVLDSVTDLAVVCWF